MLKELKEQQALNEALTRRWASVLDLEEASPIKDHRKRLVMAQLLENTKIALNEAAPTNATGSDVAGWDPILISLVRRAMPNLIAYDVCGVQPMTGPTGLIFALKSRYTSQSGTEALFNEADTDFSSGTGTHAGSNPVGGSLTAGDPSHFDGGTYGTGTGMTTAAAEALGDGVGPDFAEMAFSIEKVTVTAKSRALKAEYTMELAQDLKAVHGLDAESELAQILATEILTEINREIIRTLYRIAKPGATYGTTTAGVFDLDTDSNGRWSVEKYKGLMMQIEREANVIAKETRRGRGNFLICSSDVASALSMAGKLDYTPALSTNLQVDDTGNTFVGTLNGTYKVYIDPYFGGSSSGHELCLVGYKGTSPFDSGFFYCPYVPLQMVRAVGPDSFQPKIGFKTRYGLVGNPFYGASAGALTTNNNPYYRRVRVTNIL
jgi:hypothetical protein